MILPRRDGVSEWSGPDDGNYSVTKCSGKHGTIKELMYVTFFTQFFRPTSHFKRNGGGWVARFEIEKLQKGV
eukprot:6490809-Amphidinium_carterae.2